MKVIIAGSRSIIDRHLVDEAVEASGFYISEVVCGGTAGVDELGRQWARNRHIPARMFQADWKQYGKSAGAIRNAEMASYAEGLIAVHDGKSPGTANMIAVARQKGLRVFSVCVKPPLSS